MACHRRPRSPEARADRARAVRVTALSVTVATAAVAATAVPVLAEPGGPAEASSQAADATPGTSAEAAAEVERLLVEAERAVEAYNGASERVEGLEEELERRQDRVARGQQALNEQRRALGSAAAAQYRSGGIDPSLALLLTADPDGYLDRAATLDRVGDRQTGALRELRAVQRGLEQRRQEARRALRELTEERQRLTRAKTTAQRRLEAARSHFATLSAQEREERERAAARATGAATVSLGGGAAGAPSSRAATAVAAATSAVGRPYAWGQAGPDAFDCSGLVQWAYAQAGVALPRTSQGQATAGRPVPLSQALPGDIVAFRSDASHVGIYVGDGQMIHSPHPGASVRYDPVGIMPVSSVVRP
ncbi:NlpC/P60 family protein [Streptomyces sp. 4N509B]|uniref:NlpC/P60 family protein n=1 Tax=Streptomyces sp. 4N509B TaxID=3457413 RepID=UPI003FD1D405